MTETLQNMPPKDLFHFCSEQEAVPCQLLQGTTGLTNQELKGKQNQATHMFLLQVGGCPARVSKGDRTVLLTMRSISESRHGSQCIAGRERAWVCLSALQRGKSSFPPNCSSESLMLTPNNSAGTRRQPWTQQECTAPSPAQKAQLKQ